MLSIFARKHCFCRCLWLFVCARGSACCSLIENTYLLSDGNGLPLLLVCASQSVMIFLCQIRLPVMGLRRMSFSSHGVAQVRSRARPSPPFFQGRICGHRSLFGTFDECLSADHTGCARTNSTLTTTTTYVRVTRMMHSLQSPTRSPFLEIIR